MPQGLRSELDLNAVQLRSPLLEAMHTTTPKQQPTCLTWRMHEIENVKAGPVFDAIHQLINDKKMKRLLEATFLTVLYNLFPARDYAYTQCIVSSQS